MPMTKNIKLADKKTEDSLKKLLNITDEHLHFLEEPLTKMKKAGRMANVFTATLTYTPDYCEVCGCINDGHIIIN